MKRAFIICMGLVLTSNAMASMVTISDFDTMDMDIWKDDPVNYNVYGVFNGMYFHVMDEYSRQGYTYRLLGTATEDTTYGLAAKLTYRQYADSFYGTGT